MIIYVIYGKLRLPARNEYLTFSKLFQSLNGYEINYIG